jgi:[pyruvate, water dikinase]-phosphate phosphotransferase / [pyruvate, water dikinase] kinase
MNSRRTAFFVSDRTGITVEALGHSLLTQFETVTFKEVTVPFIDSLDKTRHLAGQINEAAVRDGARPIVFSTLVQDELATALRSSTDALVINCFETFITPLEAELGTKSSHRVGGTHSVDDVVGYTRRIEAVNYSLMHDDGSSTRDFNDADIILVGVSRSGKTPTCLYLALQYGVRAANYPLIPEDFTRGGALPQSLHGFRSKLYGLTISPQRLHRIRTERKPDSHYASLDNCSYEVREAEALMRQAGIRFLDATAKSIEELASTILHDANLTRHIF